jgi:hypothetical protein
MTATGIEFKRCRDYRSKTKVTAEIVKLCQKIKEKVDRNGWDYLRIFGIGNSIISAFDPHSKEMTGLVDQVAKHLRSSGVKVKSFDTSFLGDNSSAITWTMLKNNATLEGIHNFALFYPTINPWAKKTMSLGKTASPADLAITGLTAEEKSMLLTELLKPQENVADILLAGTPTARMLDVLTKAIPSGMPKEIISILKKPGVVADDIIDMMEVTDIITNINPKMLGISLGLPKAINALYKSCCHYNDEDKEAFVARGGRVIWEYPGVRYWRPPFKLNIIHPDTVAQQAAVMMILQIINNDLGEYFLRPGKEEKSQKTIDLLEAREGCLTQLYLIKMDKKTPDNYEAEHFSSEYWDKIFKQTKEMIVNKSAGAVIREVRKLLLAWKHDPLTIIHRRPTKITKQITEFMLGLAKQYNIDINNF